VPLIAGHEFVGRISELGDGVQGLEVGQLVTGEGHIVCGRCRSCRAGRRHLCVNTVSIGVTAPGAFAEFLALPAVNVWPVAESIPLDTLAVFDPLGNAVHTALSFDLVGEDVLVTGAGPVGCLAAAVARHVGARHVVITDINPSRLALAEKMGVSLALDANAMSLADAMTSLGMQEGFDVGLEMSGSAQALEGMIAVMRHGGRIGLLGFIEGTTSMSWEPVIFGGLTIKGIYGREMFETWYKMTAMIESGLDVTPVITHHFRVADYEEAFEIMRSGRSGKIILEWLAAPSG
jgi:threonine 3-dehydrogenase